VLPFTNLSGDPDQEYFSDGITEDLIIDLSKISGLFVLARNATFTYKGATASVRRVSAELGARYVVNGSVRKADRRVRIAVQLIDAETGGHLWADRWDRDLTDVFAIQDEITHRVVDALRVTLLPSEKIAIEKLPTESIEAYRYYLLGRQCLHRKSKSTYEIAKRMFLKAIDFDANYARAHAGLAYCEAFRYLSHSADSSLEKILDTSARALNLDENLAEAHAARGLALSTAQRHEEAEQEFKWAMRIDPNLFEAYYFHARACFLQGRRAEAAELLEQAAKIDPDDYQAPIFLASFYRALDRRQEAEHAGRRGLARAERELQVHPENVRAAYLGASALAELGDTVRAKEWASRALSMEPDDFLTQYNVACVYAELQESELALELLERALCQAHSWVKEWAQSDNDLESLRSDPRFQALLNKVAD
jgi:adenylate cyclase